jgi:hypothetical protein
MPESRTRKAAAKKTAGKKTAAQEQPKPGQVSKASAWKKKKTHDLLLPSGEVCRVKRPGPELFLREGMLPDSLSTVVQQAINQGKGLPPGKTEDLVKNERDLAELIRAVDKITLEVVVEPEVQDGTGIPESERDEDVLYVDEVDLEDKMFIFNFAVGGSSDLVQFRKQLDARMGDVPA